MKERLNVMTRLELLAAIENIQGIVEDARLERGGLDRSQVIGLEDDLRALRSELRRRVVENVDDGPGPSAA